MYNLDASIFLLIITVNVLKGRRAERRTLKGVRISSIDKMLTVNGKFVVEDIPSELSLFDLPPTQTGAENIKMGSVQPCVFHP
jgi:hypothetical protein